MIFLFNGLILWPWRFRPRCRSASAQLRDQA